MKIYVGRWELLPTEWEGINSLYEQNQDGILAELAREIDKYAETHTREDNIMGAYSAGEFEDTFNHDLARRLNTEDYWIRIFE